MPPPLRQRITSSRLIVITLLAMSAVTLQIRSAEAQASDGEPADDDAADDQTLLFDENGLEIRWHLQAGVNVVREVNLFWDLSETFAPESDFDPDTSWVETYAKGGFSFRKTFDNGGVFYGKLTGVGSYTAGTDAFDASNTGRITLEDAYLAYRTGSSFFPTVDVSLGPRELVLGTGMLIANGGSSGFERGALKFGPRKAWEQAAFARITANGITATPYYIAPNELPSNDGHNKLAGLDVRYDDPRGGFLGLTYINVFKSETSYPKAAPGGIGPPEILQGGRRDTNALDLYGRTNPFEGPLENWFFTGDFAYEWNDRIDMRAWAGRARVGYEFKNIGWTPRLTYTYQTFSGDNPDTPQLERFDPLYYEGSPGAWATGSKSSMVFINSNVNASELALQVQPTERDTFTLRYSHIRANELNSPLQYGQATRVELTGGTQNVVTGVTRYHLSDDVFLEYNRVINKNAFFNAGLSASFPGAGIKELVGEDAPVWVGGFANVVVNF